MADRQDVLALEIFEDLYYFLDRKLGLLSVHSHQRKLLEEIQQMAQSERRVLEEISTPCRFLLEHLAQMQAIGSTLEMESDNILQTKTQITGISVQEWGKVKLRLGTLELSWRDTGSLYLFYPDKVEIRTEDERGSGFKLFFTFPFKSSHGLLESFQDVSIHHQVSYWHPDLNMTKKG